MAVRSLDSCLQLTGFQKGHLAPIQVVAVVVVVVVVEIAVGRARLKRLQTSMCGINQNTTVVINFYVSSSRTLIQQVVG